MVQAKSINLPCCIAEYDRLQTFFNMALDNKVISNQVVVRDLMRLVNGDLTHIGNAILKGERFVAVDEDGDLVRWSNKHLFVFNNPAHLYSVQG